MSRAKLQNTIGGSEEDTVTVPRPEHALDHTDEHQVVAADCFVSRHELAASLAHELNNPLGISVGFAETLLAKFDSSHPHARPGHGGLAVFPRGGMSI